MRQQKDDLDGPEKKTAAVATNQTEKRDPNGSQNVGIPLESDGTLVFRGTRAKTVTVDRATGVGRSAHATDLTGLRCARTGS